MPRPYWRRIAGIVGGGRGHFQSVMARHTNRLHRTPGMLVWQRNYCDHMVRNEWALDVVQRYIAGNPVRWAMDNCNPAVEGNDLQAADVWRLLQEGTG